MPERIQGRLGGSSDTLTGPRVAGFAHKKPDQLRRGWGGVGDESHSVSSKFFTEYIL